MSPAKLIVTAESKSAEITVDTEVPDTELVIDSYPDVVMLVSGNMGLAGPPGPPGQWVAMTQTEYDALSFHDPETLYVIVGPFSPYGQWVEMTQAEYDALDPPSADILYVIVE